MFPFNKGVKHSPCQEDTDFCLTDEIPHPWYFNLAAIISFQLYCNTEILPTSAHYSNNSEHSACVCQKVCLFLEAPSLRNMADTMATALHCYCCSHDINWELVQ